MTATLTCPEINCEYAAGKCGPCLLAAGRTSRDHDPTWAPQRSDVLSDELARFHDDNRLALVRYVRSRRLSAQDAEDIVNDVFLTLHRRRQAFGAVANRRAFAFKVLGDCLADHTRRLDRRPPPVDTSLYTDRGWVVADPSERVIQRVDLQRAIDTLSERQAECLRLFYFAGLKLAEIADYLDIKPSTVATYLSEGRHHLEAQLPGYRTSEEVNKR